MNLVDLPCICVFVGVTVDPIVVNQGQTPDENTSVPDKKKIISLNQEEIIWTWPYVFMQAYMQNICAPTHNTHI